MGTGVRRTISIFVRRMCTRRRNRFSSYRGRRRCHSQVRCRLLCQQHPLSNHYPHLVHLGIVRRLWLTCRIYPDSTFLLFLSLLASRTGTGSQTKNEVVKPSGGFPPLPSGNGDLTQTPYGRQSQGEDDDQADADAGDSLSPLRPVYSMGHSHDRSVSTVSSFTPSRRSGESTGHHGLLGLTPSNASLQADSDSGLASPSSPPSIARSKSSAAAKLRGLTQRYSVSLSMPLKVTNRLGSLGRKNG